VLSRKSHRSYLVVVLLTALLGSGCATQPEREAIRNESYVDIERFMGDWYVIASIPTFLEKDAFNAMERYELDDDGTINTTFSFRKGGFDGGRKQYNPRGFIFDKESNAVWGMRFVWPFKSDYRVVYVSDDYSQTIIGRNKRDFVWIMARTPSIPDEDFFNHAQMIREQGYDTSKLKLVPQRWDPEVASLILP
jgi:apolipoprotein D and lipocalin family protein